MVSDLTWNQAAVRPCGFESCALRVFQAGNKELIRSKNPISQQNLTVFPFPGESIILTWKSHCFLAFHKSMTLTNDLQPHFVTITPLTDNCLDDHLGQRKPQKLQKYCLWWKRTWQAQKNFDINIYWNLSYHSNNFQAVMLLNASGRVFAIWHGERGVLKLETRTGRCEARWGRAHVLFFYLDLRPRPRVY